MQHKKTRSKMTLLLSSVLMVVVSTFLFAEAVTAAPKDSQRLRGLAGRVFLVTTTELTGTLPPAPNCYTFNADGSWDDTGFPVPGTWGQHTNGASTTYSVSAEFAPIAGLLIQEGKVSPARGRGVLQLEAFSSFFIAGGLIFEFHSVGSEVDECPLSPPS